MRSFVESPEGARSLGQKNDTERTENVGLAMGQSLRELGFHINFAPVLDLDEFEDHPALKERCFHREPEIVGQHGAALIRGMHKAGITACGKHFPGHGSAHLDSHVALPESPRSLAELEALDLAAYRDPIAAGLDLIMTAHVRFEEISMMPSTCNSILLQGQLRQRLNFEGAVISDDLDMQGFRAIGPIRESVQKSVMAGVDILLCCKDPEVQEETLAGLVDLYASSSESRARLEQATKRAGLLFEKAHQRSAVATA